jgi:hypothetical protein
LIDTVQAHQRRTANSFEDVVTEHKVFVASTQREHRAGAVP